MVRYNAQGQWEWLGTLEYKVIRKGIKKVSKGLWSRYKTKGMRQEVLKEYWKGTIQKLLNRLCYKNTKMVNKRYEKGIERRSQKRLQKDYTLRVYKGCQKGII